MSTAVTDAAGIFIYSADVVSASKTTFNIAGDLMRINSTTTTQNNVVLDTIQATNGANVFQALGISTNTLTVKNSNLTGNSTATSDTSVSTVILQNGSKLTGTSIRSSSFRLNITLSAADTQWQVEGDSTLTNLNNSGKVDMKTHGNTLRTMSLCGNFTQQASGLIAISLSGHRWHAQCTSHRGVSN